MIKIGLTGGICSGKSTISEMLKSQEFSIIDADIIHVIDKGKLISSGNHKELLNKCGTYRSLYNIEQ